MSSKAEALARLPAAERIEHLAALTDSDRAALLYNWSFWQRPSQVTPLGPWHKWLLLTGRGFGKTRTTSQWARHKAESMPNSRGAIVAATPGDARDICVEGESGILAISPPWARPIYEPSKRRLTWPNGSIATLYSAHEPGHLRGPQHHWAVAEELCTWKKLPKTAKKLDPTKTDDPWHMLMLGLRLGDNPQIAINTTPKPIPLVRELIQDPSCVVTRGSSYENVANLADIFVKEVLDPVSGTRLGQQEIEGRVLEDSENALWKAQEIEQHRLPAHPDLVLRRHPELLRVGIGVDPTGGVAECGIVAAGLTNTQQGIILGDFSCSGKPEVWGKAVIDAAVMLDADMIVGEVNFGGEMVESTLRAAARERGDLPINWVSSRFVATTSSRGKRLRAEPVAVLGQKGMIRHAGYFPQLEGEMTTWEEGEPSPNRLDAYVFVCNELMLAHTYHEPGFHGVSFG